MDRRTFLQAEFDRYQSRWRETDRLIEQRVTTLLAAVTLSLAVLTLQSTATVDRISPAIVWGVQSGFAFATFLRLMHARFSIIRSLRMSNHLRELLRVECIRDRDVYDFIIAKDARLPKSFKALSTPMGVAAAGSVFLSLMVSALLDDHTSSSALLSLIPAATTFLLATLIFSIKAKRFDESW